MGVGFRADMKICRLQGDRYVNDSITVRASLNKNRPAERPCPFINGSRCKVARTGRGISRFISDFQKKIGVFANNVYKSALGRGMAEDIAQAFQDYLEGLGRQPPA